MNRQILKCFRPALTGLLAVGAALLASTSLHAQIDLNSSFNGPANYTPGNSASYQIVVQNVGDVAESDVDVSTNFPAGVTLDTLACTPVGTGSVCGTNQTGNDLNETGLEIAAGGSLTFDLDVTYASSMAIDPLVITATITSSVAAQSSSPQVSSPLQRVADISVSKTSTGSTYTPGASSTYQVSVNNTGPSDASGIVLTDSAPTGVTFTGWTCSPAANCPSNSGSGNLNETLALPAGGNATYQITAAFASDLQTDPITNTANVSVPAALNDPDSGDHSSGVDLARDGQADLSVAFPAVGMPTEFIPGTAGTAISYTLANAGPSDASDATLSLAWSSAVSAVTWSCTPAAACTPSSGTIAESTVSVDLAAGASATFDATMDFDSGARDALDIVPFITAGAGETDPTSSNDNDTLTLAVDRRADIQVTKTASAPVVNPDDSFTYDIEIANLGPSDVGPDPIDGSGEQGILLTDDFDDTKLDGGTSCANPEDPCWTVCADDNGVVGDYTAGNCPTPPLVLGGDISNLPIVLKAGSTTTLVASVRAGDSGSVSNTASVALGATGTAPVVSEFTSGGGADSDSVTVTIDESSDLAISKDDGLTAAVSGNEISYTIVVDNTGFVSANGVVVNDTLPLFDEPGFLSDPSLVSAGFVPGSISWQCRAFDGACCNSNSSNCGVGTPTSPEFEDVIANAVDLPGQSRVEFTVTGRIDPRASGTLDNTASLTLPAGLNDPQPANNTDTDDDTDLVRQANLTVEKSVAAPTGTGPFTLTYTVVVTNTGPSYGSDVVVADPLDHPNLDTATAQWCQRAETDPPIIPCTAADADGSGALSATFDLATGDSVAFDITVDTIAAPSGPITNTAQATNENGVVTADSVTTSLIGEAELIVDKRVVGGGPVAPGEEIEYVITVSNTDASDDVFGAEVSDVFPLPIDSLTWSCQATTPVPGDIEPLQTAGAPDTAGDAVVVSGDGRHIYVIGTEPDSVFAYDRTATPGAGYGNVTLIETETDGIDDGGDAGGVVTGMNGPLDLVLDPLGRVLYVLSHDAVDGASLAAFSRVTDPVAPTFGELTFLGAVSADLPTDPTGLAVTGDRVYVAGLGNPDPEATPGNSDPIITIFSRDPVSSLPVFDSARTAEVPANVRDLAVDAAEAFLFAGGDELRMYTIDDAQPGVPAGRLTAVSMLSDGDALFGMAMAPDLAQLVARSSSGGAGRLVVVDYLDAMDDPALSARFVFDAGDMTLPGGVTDPLLGPGAISIAPDGEHLSGVSADESALYTFRRDPGSGDLVFQEIDVVDQPSTGVNGGLREAADLVHAPDGRHLLIAAGADDPIAVPPATNPPLTVYSRRAPDPLFAFVEQERNTDADVSGLQAPNDIAVADANHVYAVSLPDNSLIRFDRFPRLGLDDDSLGMHLQFAQRYEEGGLDDVGATISGLVQPRRVLVSPDGRSVFVSSEQANSVAVFKRDADPESPDYGELTFVEVQVDGGGLVDGLSGAQGMVMDPTSSHLYVAGSFESSIAQFEREADGSLTWQRRVVSGTDGVVGLNGVRDLAIAPDGSQLMAVSTVGNALVVFDRETAAGADEGALAFVQSVVSGIGDRPMAVEIPGGSGEHAGRHVYVVGQNSNSLAVLRRVLDSTSSAFGQVQPVQLIESGVDDGPEFMNGPRDVRVSADGKRIYVAAEFSNAVVVFDRDLNTFSSRYGFASAVETRRDGVNGVDGLRQVRALALTRDSRWVYTAGFGEGAVASFRLGTGSLCTAGGSGVIEDVVDIGRGGSIEYRATGIVRPGATEPLVNTVSVSLPPNFTANNPGSCTGGADFCDTETTTLVPEGSLSIEKTSEQVSLVAGETATYRIEIQNAGPSSLVDEAGFPLTVSDLLDSNPAFVAGSATWTCEATGSGSLSFLEAEFDLDIGDPGDPGDDTGGPFDGLNGVSRLALVPGSPGLWLVASSVLDDSVSIFERDPVTGELLSQFRVASGDMLGGTPVDSLDGAQAVAVSADGAFLYVASRVSDSITVFSISDDGSGAPVLALAGDPSTNPVTGFTGLNQAVDLVLGDSPGQPTLYVAGANDNAIAVFDRDPVTGLLTHDSSVQQGVGGVDGLEDVTSLLVRGDHLYAVSPTSGSVALFDRSAGGALTWRRSYDELDLGVALDGAADLAMDSDGRFLYVAATNSNRILVLERDTSGGGTDGELTFRSAVEQGVAGVNGLSGVGQLAVSLDGVHVYATSAVGSSVAWFIRDDNDGSLTFGGLRGNEGNEVTGLGGATGVVADPLLDQVFVAGTAQGAIARFQRTSDSFCPASGSGELDGEGFNIGAGGTVIFTIEVEVAGGTTGVVDNVATLNAARDPDNPVQTSTESNVVSTIADLAITKDDGERELDGLAGALGLAGTDLNVYTAAPDDNAIGVFARNLDPGGDCPPTPPQELCDGDLSFLQALRSGEGGNEGISGVVDLAVSADGAQVYAVSPVDNAITTFDRSDDDGTLTFADVARNGIDGVSGISGASALALSPDDAHVYVTGAFANAVAVFERQFDDSLPEFGHLTFLEFEQNGVGGVTGIGEATALVVSADGRHVYVAGAENDTLAVFERNRLPASAGYGLIEYVTHYTQNVGGVAGLEGIRDLAISADGNIVYALGQATGTIARFSRDPATGELTFRDFKQDGTSGTTGLTGARRLLLDDAGASLFASGAAAEAVVRFDVGDDADPALEGALDFAGLLANGDPAPLTGGSVFGLEGATGLFATPDGRHLYTAGSGRGAVLALQRDATPAGIGFQQILIDGLGGVAPGTTVVYQIVVENLGPSNVPQARVQDPFPDGFDSVTWTCSADGGTMAGCLFGPFSGDVDAEVSLPVGGRATIRAEGTISAEATGRLVNTATITALGVQDPDLSNNSATDDDTVLSPAANLVVTVDNGIDDPDRAIPGAPVAYDVVVSNLGPSSVRGVFVDDDFPPAMFDTVWSCVATPSPGTLDAPLEADTISLPTAMAISADGRWAYVAAGASVEAFRRDPLTGSLTPDEVYADGADGIAGLQGAADVVLTGGGRFLYVAGASSDAIALFSRDTSTGELEFENAWFDGLGGVEGLGGVNRLLVSPDGNWLYAAGAQDNAIAVFGISGVDGALSQAAVFAQGVDGIDGLNGITDIGFAEDASLLMVTADANQSLTTFDRNPATGALTFVGILFNDDLLGGAFEDGLLGASDLIEADDELLVASATGDRITRFEFRDVTVDDVDRRLPSAIGTIDATVLGESFVAPGRMAFDPDRARLYVTGIDELLLLNLFGESPVVVERYLVADHAVLGGVSALALGPALRHLHTFGTETTAEIGSWARERGSRCPLAGTGDLGRQQVDLVAGGQLAYRIEGTIQPNATGTLDYTVTVENPSASQELDPSDNSATDSDLLEPAPDLATVKLLETAPIVAGLPVDWSIEVTNAGLSDAAGALVTDRPPIFPVDPDGILTGSGSWTCDANAPLSAPALYPASESISSLAIDPERSWLYATSADSDALLAFPLDASGAPGAPLVIREGDVFPQDGGQPDLEVTGLAGASDVVAASGGLHVYATGETGDSVVVFAREDVGDPLEYIQSQTTESPPGGSSIPGLRGARSVALSPDERFVFVAGSESNAIAVFQRDETTGELTFVERVADGIGTIVPEFDVIRGVSALHPAILGSDLYAVAEDSDAVSRFSINQDTGVLTFEQVLRAGGGVPDMTGTRDLSAAPGDTHLYVLTDAGIAIFARAEDGSLAYDGLFDPDGGTADAIAMAVDAAGSRAYLLATELGSPVIHVLRRDWADGSLEFWFTQPIGGGVPAALLQNAPLKHLLVGGDGPDLLRFDELALSRCAATEGTADELVTTVDLGVGGRSDYDFTATVHPSARGTLENTVDVAPGSGTDPDPGNNSSTVSGPITVVSDIGVTKTGPVDAVAGTVITYSIAVTNAGPSDALGIQVADLAPAELSGFDWTCTPTLGSTCPASGTTAPDFTADVLVGGQLDITLQAMIDPAFIGDLINVVLLTPEAGATDPTPGDQRAEWITTVRAEADVSTTKDTLTDPVVAGLPVSYLVAVFNGGPSQADVQVSDTLPAVLTATVWTCTGFDGATCPPSGAGNPDVTITMPPGSSIELTVGGDLAPDATGSLVNTAAATVQAPATDPVPGNDGASVTDPIVIRSDIALTLDDPLDPFDPGSPFDFPLVATLSNVGPSVAPDVVLDLDASANLTLASGGCVQPTGDTVTCQQAPLAPGEVRTVSLAFTGLPPAPGTLVIDGLVSTSGEDLNLADNSDSTSTELLSGVDLVVELDNGRTWLSPDEVATWTLDIRNYGSVDAPVVDVSAGVPVELLGATWTCVADGSAACTASGSGSITDVADIPSGGRVTYTLVATVDPALDLSVPQSVVISALAESSPPSADINPANNLAVDDDEVRLVMFEDGFESPVRTPAAKLALPPAEHGCIQVDLALASGDRVLDSAVFTGRALDGSVLFDLHRTVRGRDAWFRLATRDLRDLRAGDWRLAGAAGDPLRLSIDGRRVEVAVGGRDIAGTSGLRAPIRALERAAIDGAGPVPPLAWRACEEAAR
ncbi:beta-propeller fold lactonase family protein [Halomonas denitrificans]|nr:beta-propeller fold lactonase family protein [Halomonas denitrificans]